MKQIFKSNGAQGVLLVFFIVCAFSLSQNAFATWSGEPYSQGETLNPECAPTNENCTVSIAEPGNLFSLNGVTYIGTLAHEIAAPTSVSVEMSPSEDGGYGRESFDIHYPFTNAYRVYSYKNIGDGLRLYSSTYTEKFLKVNLDQVEGNYNFAISWDPVDGADGYRVFHSGIGADGTEDEYSRGTSFTAYIDTTETSFSDNNNVDWLTVDSQTMPNGIPLAVDETYGTVGIGVAPDKNYSLSIAGDTLTNGSMFFGNPAINTGGIHYGPTGLYGQAQHWNPNPDPDPEDTGSSGIWIEGTKNNEGSGFYADGDMTAIWSAGDVDLLRVYDEDSLPSNKADFIVGRNGALRSDTGGLAVNDTLDITGMATVGDATNYARSGERVGDRGTLTIQQRDPGAEDQIADGGFNYGISEWHLGLGWNDDESAAVFAPADYDEDVNKTLYQTGDLNEGATYDVSFTITGSNGSVFVCLGGGHCETIDAGEGDVSFSGQWHKNDNQKISFSPSNDFDGTIDNVSVMSREVQGLTFLAPNDRTSLSLGIDNEEGNSEEGQHGFLIKTIDSSGNSHAASLYLPDDNNSRYEYVLPSLLTVDDGNDTFCMKYLGNCTEGITSSQWTDVGSGINFLPQGLVGIGSTSNDAKLSVNASTGGALALELLGTKSDLGDTKDVVMLGNYAYSIGNGGNSIDITSIGDPSNLTAVSSVAPTSDGASRLSISSNGDYLFAAEGTDIEIFSLEDASDPISLAVWHGNFNVNDIAVKGNDLYAATNEGFVDIDISTIDAPVTVVDLSQSEASAQGIALSDDGYAYVTSGSDIFSYAIGSNHSVTFITDFALDGNLTGRPAISGSYLYTTNDVNDATQSFVVYSINHGNITLAGYANIGSYRYNGSVVIKNNYAYVADGAPDSLYIFDVSDPANITQLANYNSESDSDAVALSGSTIILAAGDGGIHTLTLSTDQNPELALKTSGGDVLIGGTDDEFHRRYFNFGTAVGESGFGIRNNNGTMQFRNSGDGDEWTDFGSGSGDSAWNGNESGINFLSGNVGIGTTTPGSTLEIFGDGSGEFAGGYPSLLNIHTTDSNPWGLTFQNDLAGTDKEMGVFLNSDGDLVFGADDDHTSMTLGHLGQVGINTTELSNANLTIRQTSNSESVNVEELTNGSFDGNAVGWMLGDGWSYDDNDVVADEATDSSGPITSFIELTDGGSGYVPDEIVHVDGGNGDATMEILSVSGVPDSFSVSTAGSGYTEGDTITVSGFNGDATLSVDSVDGDGAIVGISIISNTASFGSDMNEVVSGGTGSGGYLSQDVPSGAIRGFNGNTILTAGDGYTDGAGYSLTATSGSGAVATFHTEVGESSNLSQGDGLDAGEYRLSFTIGEGEGEIEACIGSVSEDTCNTYSAGNGDVSFSSTLNGSADSFTVEFMPIGGAFSGSISNVSLMRSEETGTAPGLTIMASNAPVSVSIGADVGEITDATGIKFTTSDPGHTESASFFLSGDDDAHYGYQLPSLESLMGGIDTVCMQNLGNCTGGDMQSFTTMERDNIESPTNNQIIFNTDTKTMQYYTTDNEGEWIDIAGGDSKWNTNEDGIDYTNGNVGIGTNTPHAGLDVVGGSAGVGFSQITRYHDVQTGVMDLVVSGNKLYSVDGYHLDIFDITDPVDETLLTYYDFQGDNVTPTAVRVVGDIAYVAAGNSVYVLDVNDTSQTPILLGVSDEGPAQIEDIQVKNGIVYVTDNNGYFYALNVSAISHGHSGDPVFFSEPYQADDSAYRIAISDNGHYAYLEEDTEIEVVDITDPTDFEQMSLYPSEADYFDGGIATKGNYVYATRDTDDGEGFVVFDASDPENLVKVGSTSIGDWRYNTRITISGNIAYVADGAEDSVYAINISYPHNPITIGYGTTDGDSYAVAAYKDVLFVADGDNGIVVLNAPKNYSALFNGGNVGIGTNDPAFNLDVGAIKATATLTIGEVIDGDAFLLFDSQNSMHAYEFDDNDTNSGAYPIPIGDTLSETINTTVNVINNGGYFSATRVGNNIIIEQLSAGASGNVWNILPDDENNPQIHPTHHSANITLTDFTGGVNGDINFGGNLYQHGQLFTGSQWTDFDGGIAYNTGDVSIGNGSFLYNSTTGVTSIDNLSMGALTFAEDAGAVSWVDLPISGDASQGTVESYTASIAGLSILTVHGEDDGEGGIENTGVRMENLPVSDEGQLSYLCINSSGELVVGSNSDCSSSSLRFKDNINSLTDDSGLTELMKLNPVSFFYKPEFNGALQSNPNYSGEQLGFIAEEVNAVDPRLVTLEADGTTVHGVRYEKITAILVKAVKEIADKLSGFTDQFTTHKLCVGDTCVTEAEFIQMVHSAGVTPVPKNDASTTPDMISIPDENSSSESDSGSSNQDVNSLDEGSTTSEVVEPTENAPTPDPTPIEDPAPNPEQLTPDPSSQVPEPSAE
ncbi:MAG: tail fiber domain-containing protein [Patescibacteria group bacterium]